MARDLEKEVKEAVEKLRRVEEILNRIKKFPEFRHRDRQYLDEYIDESHWAKSRDPERFVYVVTYHVMDIFRHIMIAGYEKLAKANQEKFDKLASLSADLIDSKSLIKLENPVYKFQDLVTYTTYNLDKDELYEEHLAASYKAIRELKKLHE